MNPARVLFALGALSGGGSERRMIELLKRLDRRRFAPELFLAYRTGELLSEVPPDVPIHADSTPPLGLTSFLAGKLRLLSEHRMGQLNRLLGERHYDLIFAWGLRRGYETALPARWRRIPRAIYCVQDPLAEVQVDFPLRSPWRYPVSRWTYRTADQIFANSEDLCRRLESFYRLPSDAVKLMVNLKDFAAIAQKASVSTPEWPFRGARLVAAGRLQEQKGFSHLLQAMAKLVHQEQRDVQLILCGQGPLEPVLHQQLSTLNLADRVRLAGFVDNPFPYFQSADVFVLSSLWEGSPNALIEAMSLGTPVVATNCPTGPREILEDGRYGTLVPPADADALAAAIGQTLDQLPGARARAQAGQTAILAKYDLATGIDHMTEQLLHVIGAHQLQTGEPCAD